MEALAYVPAIAWVLAAASLALTATLGIILVFHWFRYALAPVVSTVALVIYVTVSSVLLASMFVALLLLTVL